MSKTTEKQTYFSILFRALPVCWILAAAWPYGGATWSSQLWLNKAALAALTYSFLLALVLRQNLKLSRQSTLFISTLAAIGGWAFLQTAPWIVEASFGSQLQSIALQSEFLEIELEKLQSASAPPTLKLTQLPLATSVDRGHTLAAIPNFAAAIVAFSIGYILIGQSARVALVAFALLLANCTAIAAIGIAEDIASNKWQLMGIEMQTAFGPFVSRNSAAMFLNVGIACGFGVLACLPSNSSIDTDPTYRYSTKSPLAKATYLLEDLAADISSAKLAVGAAMVLLFVGILVTLSRGGMASAIAGFVLSACASLFRSRRIESILLISVLFALSLGLIIWLDQLELVTSRIETVTEGNAVTADLRWTVWIFAASAFSELWLTGGGLGNFHYSYLPFQSKAVDTWFYHAESFYWQAAVDLGILGIIAIAIGTTLYLNMNYRLLVETKLRDSHSLAPASIFLFSSLALHSFVDFSLVLPGIYLPACLAIGIFFAISEQKHPLRRQRKRTRTKTNTNDRQNHPQKLALLPWLPLLTAAAMLAFSSNWVIPRSQAEQLQSSFNDWRYDQDNATEELENILLKGEQALKLAPNDGQLNIILGKAYVEKFRLLRFNALPKSAASWNTTNLFLIRVNYLERLRTEQVNVDSFFSRKEEADCLTRARHCWRNAHFTLPLDWRPHVALVELDFVDFNIEQSRFHLEKLKILAFNRPKVLTHAGLLALAYPGKDMAFELLQRSLESSPSQLQLIFPIAYQQFGSRVVNEPFLPKDPISLLQLAQQESTAKLEASVVDGIWKQIEQSLPNLPDSNRQKAIISALVYQHQGNRTQQIASLRQAVTMSPVDTDLRLKYAKALLEDNQHKTALEQIETCLRQRPDSEELKALKVMIQQQDSASLTPE